MNEEKWIDCNFVGVIKKYDNEPNAPKEPVENLDDYDMRHGLGGRFCVVKSRFAHEEM